MRTWQMAWLVPVLAGCAQVRDISGGDKDSTPPTLLSAEPADMSTGFLGRRIVLHFNERVKLGRLRDQLLISPPLPTYPDVHVQGATDVVIELNDPLEPNTTYSFFLGDAVTDLTEGNAAKDLSYTISTGDHLDSASVHGMVVDAFSGKAAGNVHVLLFTEDDSTGFKEGRPAYATRSDKEGLFHLKHLRNGRYTLNGLRDQNANLRFDLPNEEVAFLNGPLALPDSIQLLLRMFLEQPEQQQVMDQRVGPDRDWRLVLAKPLTELKLRDLDRTGGALNWTVEANAAGDSVRCWPNDTTALDHQTFEVSDGGTVLDTLIYRVREKMPFYVSAVASHREGQLLLRATRPVASIAAERISVKTDTTARSFTIRMDSLDRRMVHLLFDLKAGQEATATLMPKALEDIYGGVNDTLVLSTRRPGAEQLGGLTITIKDTMAGTSTPFLLQLLNTADQVVEQRSSNGLSRSFRLAGLIPGSYTLKLVEDRNDSGKQDTGELDARRQPERAWRMAGVVMVRAGWDVEQTWEVDLR
ncbi:MAG: Ig-like domain-containing protein [Flavobacteriales bacterium]|nr:Ig-like domain-containing protein [Flavobacteriales bacterium]